MRLNDQERELWVMNDEGLYLWWKGSGTSIARWVRNHRREIDAVIKPRKTMHIYRCSPGLRECIGTADVIPDVDEIECDADLPEEVYFQLDCAAIDGTPEGEFEIEGVQYAYTIE